GIALAAGPALAAGFVLIHAVVSRREQCLVGLAVQREHSGAHTDSELHPLAWTRLEKHLVDALLQFLALVLRFVRAAAREDHDELVPGVAHADVVGPDGSPEDQRDFAERPVPDMVAVAVVDLLEV